MVREQTDRYIEALIFASDKGVTEDEIRMVLDSTAPEGKIEINVEDSINRIQSRYDQLDLSIQLVKSGGAYHFLTRKEYFPVIQQLQIQRSKKKLSQAALETLAIIAYKQPVTKLEIEHIRGVNCDYSLQRLLEKQLIDIIGKSESVGRPLLYGTSKTFMDYFGINSATELPQLIDIQANVNSIGEQSD